MRKFLIAAALAFSLGGCAVAEFATVGVNNPITNRELAAIEQSYKVVLRPTVAYIELRTCSHSKPFTIASPCGDYNTKLTLQGALSQAQKYRRELSLFVRQNKTIDARAAFNGLNRAIAIMRDTPKGG